MTSSSPFCPHQTPANYLRLALNGLHPCVVGQAEKSRQMEHFCNCCVCALHVVTVLLCVCLILQPCWSSVARERRGRKSLFTQTANRLGNNAGKEVSRLSVWLLQLPAHTHTHSTEKKKKRKKKKQDLITTETLADDCQHGRRRDFYQFLPRKLISSQSPARVWVCVCLSMYMSFIAWGVCLALACADLESCGSMVEG